MQRAFVGWGAMLALVVALLCANAEAAPADSVPKGFFGVVPQTAVGPSDLDRMAGAVGTLRLPVAWFQLEPEPGHYVFDQLDEEVVAAADRGIVVLPFVGGTPAWLAPDSARVPLGSARFRRAWVSFLRTLVHRYGPRGTIWRGRSQRQPIRRWQVWNEPNFRLYWKPRPSPRRYAQLLALAAEAIRGADPGARIVTGGVAPVGAGLLPWVFLRRLYRVPGAERNFDMVAVHPYAVSVGRMSEQIRAAREVMAAAGDGRTPLLVSELGVASWGSFPSGFVRGSQGQAEFLRRAFAQLLAKRRPWHLAGVDWFTWEDVERADPHCSFCQGAGLLDLEGRPKPAWWAFRRAVEEAHVR